MLFGRKSACRILEGIYCRAMASHCHVSVIPLRQRQESEKTPTLLYQASRSRPRSDTGAIENEQSLVGC